MLTLRTNIIQIMEAHHQAWVAEVKKAYETGEALGDLSGVFSKAVVSVDSALADFETRQKRKKSWFK